MSKKEKEYSALKRLTEDIFKIFHKHPNRTFNYKQLLKQVKASYYAFRIDEELARESMDELHHELKHNIISTLQELAAKGDLIEVNSGAYKLKPVHAYMEGILDIAQSGDAYLKSEN